MKVYIWESYWLSGYDDGAIVACANSIEEARQLVLDKATKAINARKDYECQDHQSESSYDKTRIKEISKHAEREIKKVTEDLLKTPKIHDMPYVHFIRGSD